LEPRVVPSGTTWLSTNGVYDLVRPNAAIAAEALTNPNVDGVSLRTYWNSVETADGVYNWGYLDQQIAAAGAAGKKISLSVKAGVNTPSWVYTAGARSFTFIDNTSPLPQTIPVPWDPVFQAKWQAFVAAFGARYTANPSVAQVKITGINTGTNETSLPHSRGATASNGTATWVTTNDVLDWQLIGYTRTRLEQAWKQIADTFARAFPGQQIDDVGQPNAFPTIDGSGNVFSSPSGGDEKAVKDIINLGITSYGSQFVVQNNGLSDYFIDADVTAKASQLTTGYQMLWWVTNDTTYKMNKGTPIDAHTELQTAVNKGLAGGAQFLEIYETDIENPTLQDIIANAHAALKKANPTATITGVPASGQSPRAVPVTLGTTVADPVSANPAGFQYSWMVTDNGMVFAIGSGATFTFTPNVAASYVVTLTVTDQVGLKSPAQQVTIKAV
jgi:hypothetical protein